MITTLRLLQTKYSLSDEFIANAIRAEIERQALLDIKGVISNASVTSLYDVICKIMVNSSGPLNGPSVVPIDDIESVVKEYVDGISGGKVTVEDVSAEPGKVVGNESVHSEDAANLIVDKDKFVEETKKIVDDAVNKITGNNRGNRRGGQR